MEQLAISLLGVVGLARKRPSTRRDAATKGPETRRGGADDISTLNATLDAFPDAAAVLSAASRRARTVADADAAAVLVTGLQGVRYYARHGWKEEPVTAATVFRSSRSGSGQVDDPRDGSSEFDLRLSGPNGAKRVLSSPLFGDGLPTAALVVWRRRDDPFSSEDVDQLAHLAKTTSAAWRHVLALEQDTEEKSWRGVLDLTPLPRLVMRSDTTIAAANREAEHLFAHRGGLRGRTLTDVLPGVESLLRSSEVHVAGQALLPSNGEPPRRLALEIEPYEMPEGPWRLVTLRPCPAQEPAEPRGPLDGQECPPVDLRSLLETAMTRWTDLHRDRGIQCELRLPERAALTRDNGHGLEHVVQHLLQNAADAVSSVAVRRVIVALTDEDGHWLVSVDDNGPGVPYPLRSKVFEPFYTTKPEGEGSGLGLTAALGLAKRNGGELRVRTGKIGGARFELRLPHA